MVATLTKAYARTRPLAVLPRMTSYLFFEGRPLTTRGRWINPLVFGLLGTCKRLPISGRIQKPIFILGSGRSGSTILGHLLSLHRDVGFLNEPKALWHTVHPNEDVIGSYDRGEARYRLDESDATPERIRDYHRILRAYLACTGSRRLVDKYGELIFRVPFLRRLCPDAKFIFLVRNGRDTCRSIASMSERMTVTRNGETHNWWGATDRKWKLMVEQLVAADSELGTHREAIGGFSKPLDKAAVEWILTAKEGRKVMNDHPDAIHLLRFESLTQNPRATLEALAAFCALRPDPTFFDYAQRTLKPVPAYEPFDLNPLIEPQFQAMMEALNYA